LQNANGAIPNTIPGFTAFGAERARSEQPGTNEQEIITMADKTLCGAKGKAGALGKVACHRPAGHSGPHHAKGLSWGGTLAKPKVGVACVRDCRR
jgi:hypothetical protein